ncbi:MAG: hypothetical protein LBN99_04825 [Oscillospiraceae bacterium]|jgi:hypothetical protein|nr:hypothetical protein [Oscillospiraceae bacterium]
MFFKIVIAVVVILVLLAIGGNLVGALKRRRETPEKRLAKAQRYAAKGWPAGIDKVIPQRPEAPSEPERGGRYETYDYGYSPGDCPAYDCPDADVSCTHCGVNAGTEFVPGNQSVWRSYRRKSKAWNREYRKLAELQELKKLL